MSLRQCMYTYFIKYYANFSEKFAKLTK